MKQKPADASRVAWAQAAANPDYCMLPIWLGAPLTDQAFTFTFETLKRMMAKAAFPTELDSAVMLAGGAFVFTLRGCMIASGARQASGAALALRAVTPDHRTYRCLVGVAEPGTRMLHVYRASTVANATAMVAQARAGLDYDVANYLPTGRYRYTVGAHGKYPTSQGGFFAAALKLSSRDGKAAQTVVLRPARLSSAPISIDGTGHWSLGRQGDNIHPARTPKRKSWELFSSEGCTVIDSSEGISIPGSPLAGMTAGGEWGAFAATLGISRDTVGKSVLGVSFTGHEALIASRNLLRSSLRTGSRSSQVGALGRLLAAYGAERRWQDAIPPPGAADSDGPAAQLGNLVNAWLIQKASRSVVHPPAVDTYGPQIGLAWLAFQHDHREVFAKGLSRQTLSPIVTRAALELADGLDGAARAARRSTGLDFADQITAS